MKAEFQVRDSFDMTGRGGILMGDILNGTLKIGMKVVAVDERALDEPLTVSAVEFVDHLDRQSVSIGLGFEEFPDKKLLDEMFAKNSTLTLQSDEP